MAGTQKGKAYDEALVTYFIEKVCSEVDPVYRFAFILTLSLDGARSVVDKVFEEVATELESHRDPEKLSSLLVTETWKAYGELKKGGFQEGHSAVIKALKPISEKARAALFSVDVMGLRADDAAKALGWEEIELRKNLGSARKALMTGNLDF